MLFLSITKCCKLDCFTPEVRQRCVVQMKKPPGIASGKIISAPALYRYRYPHAANMNNKKENKL